MRDSVILDLRPYNPLTSHLLSQSYIYPASNGLTQTDRGMYTEIGKGVSYILIKITQCQYLVRTFLQNGSTDFDEILHVAWEWLPEGYGISGRSG